MCPECRKLKGERLFHECHVCGSIACEFCLNRCEKCTNIFCSSCFQTQTCSFCPTKYSKCSPILEVNCSKCNAIIILSHNCSKITCLFCKKHFCQKYNPNSKLDKQVICIPCIILNPSSCMSLNGNPFKLLPISVTSTYNNSYPLENTVIPGTGSYWLSRQYAAGDRPGAEDDITYRVDGGEHLILKLHVISHPNCQFGQMRVFLGVGEDNYVLHSTITQWVEDIEIKSTEITPVQFIKLSFKRITQGNYFMICEVKAFEYKV